MAMTTTRLVQDQNVDVQYPGGALLGGKTNVSKAPKKGGLGGRKALNDISNSGKPSANQASKKYSSNVIPIGKDVSASSKTPFSVGGKPNSAKSTTTSEKGKVAGRKALTDLTNTDKPSLQAVNSKKNQDKKLIAIAEEDEGFLHNHRECIKAQRSTMDKDHFLKAVGLGGSPFAAPLPPLSKLKPASPLKHLEMEEMPVQLKEDWGPKRKDILGCASPACGSPVSSKPSYTSWNEDNFLDFALIETPKLRTR